MTLLLLDIALKTFSWLPLKAPLNEIIKFLHPLITMHYLTLIKLADTLIYVHMEPRLTDSHLTIFVLYPFTSFTHQKALKILWSLMPLTFLNASC